MTLITGIIADSAGSPANGRIEFTQVSRIDTGSELVTGTTATAQVVEGELRALDGTAFSLPMNPEGTAVRVREILSGRTFEWWTQIPATDVEYRSLVPVEPVGTPLYAAPPWLNDVLQARDDTLTAASDAATDAAAAEAARAAAVVAKNAAEAVGNTNDSIMAAVVANPGSAFASQLSATYAGLGSIPVDAIATGVPSNGTTSASAAITALLGNGAVTRLYFGPGTYLISSTVTATLTRSVTVEAHPDAIFKLADNARCWMFNLIGNNVANFTWLGGRFDGNDPNQGDEAADGDAFDVSKGIRVIKFRRVEIGNMRMKDIRGHCINHWNNNAFYAHDIVFDQRISQISPVGGRRRDGVTGSSTYNTFERITGFTSDDLIAVIAGANWGGSGTTPQDVVSVTARNIRCETKLDIDGTTRRKTWHGVVGYAMLGATMGSFEATDVAGETECGHVRVGGYATDYYGTFTSVALRNIKGQAHSATQESFIYIGGSTAGGPCTVKSISIDGVAREVIVDNPTQMVTFGHMVGENAQITNSTVSYRVGTTSRAPFLKESGAGTCAAISLANIAVRDDVTPNNTSLRAYEKATSDNTTFTQLHAKNLDLGPVASGANKPYINVTVGQGKVAVFGDEVVVANYNITERIPGASCFDKSVGTMVVDSNLNWTQRTKNIYAWNTTNYGVPTAGYWYVGMECLSPGSPFGECVGWRCITAGTAGSGAAFEIISPASPRSNVIGPTWVPTATNVTPGAVIVCEIGSGSATGYPADKPGILTTYVGKTGLAFSYQTYETRGDQSSPTFYRRRLNGSAWTAWV